MFTSLFGRHAAAVLAAGSLSMLPPSAAGNPDRTPQIDQKAANIMRGLDAKLQRAKTVKATVRYAQYDETGHKKDSSIGYYEMARPASFRVVGIVSGRNKLDTTYTFADSAYQWKYNQRDTSYYASKYAGAISQFVQPVTLTAFFPAGEDGDAPHWEADRLNDLTCRGLTYVGKETWEGKSYNVVDWKFETAFAQESEATTHTARLYIGDDSLIHRVLFSSSRTKGQEHNEQILESITLNASIPASDFESPKSMKRLTYSFQEGRPNGMVGKLASDFTLPTAMGDSVTLDGLLKGKKALLIHVWWFG